MCRKRTIIHPEINAQYYIKLHLLKEVRDGWNTEPFKMTFDKETGRLYGRGSTDDKGPIMGWLNVLEAHHTLGIPLPVNLRFCFEGMEESGSEGLDDLIKSEVGKGKFFEGVEAVCIVSASPKQLHERGI